MRLINWNIERRLPGSWQAASLVSELKALSADIICLTEAHAQSLSELDGDSISARGIPWSPQKENERKVLLWSRYQWDNHHIPTEMGNLGGALFGRTKFGKQSIEVLGMCIPYHAASPHGQTEKSIQWREHAKFCSALSDWMKARSSETPLLIMGDFNRRIPYSGWGPKDTHKDLISAFSGYEIVTANTDSVCHIVAPPKLRLSSLEPLSKRDASGKLRTDHDGWLAEFAYQAS